MTASSTQREGATPLDVPATERLWARKRLEAKRKLRSDILFYFLVNPFLVVIWAVGGRGATSGQAGCWADGASCSCSTGYKTYLRRPITEADVDEELRRHR